MTYREDSAIEVRNSATEVSLISMNTRLSDVKGENSAAKTSNVLKTWIGAAGKLSHKVYVKRADLNILLFYSMTMVCTMFYV